MEKSLNNNKDTFIFCLNNLFFCFTKIMAFCILGMLYSPFKYGQEAPKPRLSCHQRMIRLKEIAMLTSELLTMILSGSNFAFFMRSLSVIASISRVSFKCFNKVFALNWKPTRSKISNSYGNSLQFKSPKTHSKNEIS